MKKPVDNHRGKTDTSLTGERSKTDHYIDTKIEKVNKVINDKIGQNRIKSDKDKKSARAA